MSPLSPALFAFARPNAIRYTVAMARLAHFAIAAGVGLLALSLFQDDPMALFGEHLALSLLAGLLCLLVFQTLDLYGHQMFSHLLLIRRVFFAWSAAFALVMTLHGLFRALSPLPPKTLAVWYLLGLGLFVLSRLVMLWFFQRRIRQGHFIQRSVILGMTENALRLAEQVHHRADVASGLIGYIDDRRSHRLSETPPPELPRLGDIGALEQLIRDGRVDQVLVALPAQAQGRNEALAQRLRRLPVQVLLIPDMTTFRFAHRRMVPMGGVPMFVVAEPPLQGWAPLLKRCEDLVLSGLALLALAPLMLLIALAVKLDSPGPVLFRQKRYGYNHRLIEVYKFRSMHHHLRDDHADRQTGRGDPRVTRVGRFIRKTSLDELPQLLNVFGGSMSMVGPRPHATATKAANVLFEDAVEEYVARHRVKPGITGLAQVNGYRGETDTLEKIQKRVEYDLEYIENWSLWLDLSILLRTVPAVLSTQAAY
ncbi:undecaprenyl-phosphate glucose phosphotransferase [Pseudomonas sp. CGJS7]|uniref:undecaprenyl-phosphate glucose phosphotransferase n=1 Tax=Pseudomonas sp. CGJS7 TaxID=3109348 RepID=UPI003008067C